MATATCIIANSYMHNNFFPFIDGCTRPVIPTNAVLYNASISSDSMSVIAPGKAVTIACEFILSFYLLTCQDNGMWYPEPGNISCPSELSNNIIL